MFLSTNPLAAQQPQHRMPSDSTSQGRMMGMDMQQHMRMMDSLTVRLDTLVDRMNQSTGNAKVTAMAQVINQLVAERHLMQRHMHHMMQSRGMQPHGMMGANDSGRPHTSMPRSRADTADSGHGRHQPQ